MLNTTKPTNTSKKKRYNLALPPELFEQLQKVANEQDVAVVDVLKRFIKIGLVTNEVSKREDAALIIRRGDVEQQIVFI